MQVSELTSNEAVMVSHAHEQAAGKMNNSPYSTVGQSSSSDEMKLRGADCVSLLQLPDEILISIFLNLGGGSRIALGTTCKKFYNLIFSDKKLLRRLDFSEEGYLRGISDIARYLCDKERYLHIHKLIIRNNYCIDPGDILTIVGKTQNLVEIDVVGTQLKTFGQIKQLLSSLQHVTRLSISWDDCWEQLSGKEEIYGLQKGFGRLKYLFLHVSDYRWYMSYALGLCQELEELVIITTRIASSYSAYEDGLRTPLRKLKKFVCVNVIPHHFSDKDDVIMMTMLPVHDIMTMLPDLDEWVCFYYDENTYSCYMEKKTGIPEEYTNDILGIEYGLFRSQHEHTIRPSATSVLRSTVLLKEAIELTKGKIVNEHLQRLLLVYGADFIISIEDSKKLLRNPRHEITFLNIEHKEELNNINVCSALTDFPALKKLVLPSFDRHVSHVADTSTADSSFRKLTESTPYLESFTVIAVPQFSYERVRDGIEWDIPALVFISNWKNLTALCLVRVPILNGKFLIEIGKTCEELKELTLIELGPEFIPQYEREKIREYNREYSGDLIEMLKCCRNLQSFMMSQKNFDGMVSVFDTLFRNCPKLRDVMSQKKVLLLDALIRNCPKLKDVGISGLSLGIKEVENKVIELIQSTEIVLFKCQDDSFTRMTVLLERCWEVFQNQ